MINMKNYVESIKRWIDRRKENKEINKEIFYISSQYNYLDYGNLKEDSYMEEVIKILERAKIKYSVVDNVFGAFNLNRDWIETEPFDAIIEFCGVYSVDMDPKDSARLSELDDNGDIRIQVMVIKEDGAREPNR